jgi:hypothetical protein
MAENKSPGIIVRHRQNGGAVMHGDRLPTRYWKSRRDGSNIMVVRYLRIANEGKKRVVFVNEDMPTREVSEDLAVFLRDYEALGQTSSKF